MKKILLAASALCFCFNIFAQHPADYVMGNTGVINDAKLTLEILENNYPGFKQAANNAFQNSHQFSNKSGQVYTVNVVVHVVWNSSDPDENIPDSVIHNQIDILNQDFGRTNADTVNLRSIFEPIAGNPHIQFNLSHIERVETTETFGVSFAGLPDAVKQTAQGGSDAWNTQYYMNIWVCKLQNTFGALFGYAYPPAGLSNWPSNSNAPSPELDGVVLDYRTVGDNNSVPYPDPNGGSGNVVFTGRTATHEVGHYLGLRHIWGDGGGLFGGESCGDDDGMNDTPNQGYQSNFDCSTVNNTCIDSLAGQPDPNDMPDLIENHMDYSSETCKNMFTLDQAMHMRGVLENERQDLLSTAASVGKNALEVISVYPNPSSTNFTLLNVPEYANLQVHDSYGRLISHFNTNSSRVELHSNEWSKGVYFVTVTTGNDRVTKKIVKK